MCADRLAVGEAPACVQACPNQAIKIKTVSRSEVVSRNALGDASLIPGAPLSQWTEPSTRYLSASNKAQRLLPVDFTVAKPLHAHWPLVFMLVLTQMALGVFLIGGLVEWLAPAANSFRLTMVNAAAMAFLGLGLNVALLHLGRPLKAYRAMANLRRSWLSREIAGFNAFAGSATLALLIGVVPFLRSRWGDWQLLMTGATVVAGIIAVSCSAMLYIVTGRPLWRSTRTGLLFGGTSVVLGIAGTIFLLGLTSSAFWKPLIGIVGVTGAISSMSELRWPMAVQSATLSIAVLIKLWIEYVSLKQPPSSNEFTSFVLARRLLTREFRSLSTLRLALAGACGVALPLVIAGLCLVTVPNAVTMIVLVGVMLGGVFAGEISERYLFFATATARRMPGAPNQH